MSWIKENKFAASLLGVSAVASGVLFYLGMDARSEAEQANADKADAIRQINTLKASKPYPDAENRKMVKDKVAEFAADTYAFQQDLLKFRPAEMPSVSPGDFNKKVGEYVKQLKDYYTDNGVALPASTSFGIEAYDGKLADKSATRELDYERRALEWLFKSLADAKPTALVNVHRQPIEAEKSSSKKQKKKKTNSNNVTSVYQAMPVEVTFRGSEKSLQDFLATIAESKEYFYAVRAIRLQNQNTESPDLSAAEFPKPVASAAANDLFGASGDDGFGASSDEKIIKKVVGDETITAYLKLDLVLFKPADEVKIPAYKAPKTETKN